MIEFTHTIDLHPKAAARFHQQVVEYGGMITGMESVEDRNHRVRSWRFGVSFQEPLKAAIFLATISADKERAAMFKMFWSGE